MLKLHYTKQDLINETLRSHVGTMIMLWATHDGDCLCFHWEYDTTDIFDYIVEYKCFIKLAKELREWEVFVWMSWRENPVLDENGEETWEVSVLSFQDWKPSNYDTPILHEWFYYIPSDMMSRDDAKIILQNLGEIVTIQEYKELQSILSPSDFI